MLTQSSLDLTDIDKVSKESLLTTCAVRRTDPVLVLTVESASWAQPGTFSPLIKQHAVVLTSF